MVSLAALACRTNKAWFVDGTGGSSPVPRMGEIIPSIASRRSLRSLHLDPARLRGGDRPDWRGMERISWKGYKKCVASAPPVNICHAITAVGVGTGLAGLARRHGLAAVCTHAGLSEGRSKYRSLGPRNHRVCRPQGRGQLQYFCSVPPN